VLAPLITGLVVLVLLVGMVDVVLVFLIRATLHAGAAWYGVVGAAWIAGLVAGSLGAGRLRTERVQTWATIAGAGVTCAALARVSATATAALGGAQGVSLLAGGAVAAVLSPREIYTTAGLLGVAVAIALAVFCAARTARTGQHVLPRSQEPLSN
jgi:hypothetical protein